MERRRRMNVDRYPQTPHRQPNMTACTESKIPIRQMDAGAVVVWPERHNADELSAAQHAMKLKFRDEEGQIPICGL